MLEVEIVLAGTGELDRQELVVCSREWGMRSMFVGRNGRSVGIVGVRAEHGPLGSKRGWVLEGRVSDCKGLSAITVPYRRKS